MFDGNRYEQIFSRTVERRAGQPCERPGAGPVSCAERPFPRRPPDMIRIPSLRFGKPYTSLDKATLVHHVTGEPVAEVSQVTGSMIARDLGRAESLRKELAEIPIRDILGIYRKAADYFTNGSLPCGETEQS